MASIVWHYMISRWGANYCGTMASKEVLLLGCKGGRGPIQGVCYDNYYVNVVWLLLHCKCSSALSSHSESSGASRGSSSPFPSCSPFSLVELSQTSFSESSGANRGSRFCSPISHLEFGRMSGAQVLFNLFSVKAALKGRGTLERVGL